MCSQKVPAKPLYYDDDSSKQDLTEPEQPNRLGVDVPVLLVESHLKVGEAEPDQEVLSSELRAKLCPRTVEQSEILIQVVDNPNMSTDRHDNGWSGWVCL